MKLDQQAAALAYAQQQQQQQQPSAASFNFDQMHSTIESIETSVVEQVPPPTKKSSRSSSKHITTDSDAIHVASSSNGKIEANGSKAALLAAAAASNEGPPSASNAPLGNKKAKYKGLWGKVGQHGLMQAAKQKGGPESSSSASSGSTRNRKGGGGSGWDQLLQPVIQRQREAYHARQVQIGAASGGSGWTDANMECDCGQDSCPRCNLLLQMDGDQQW